MLPSLPPLILLVARALVADGERRFSFGNDNHEEARPRQTGLAAAARDGALLLAAWDWCFAGDDCSFC